MPKNFHESFAGVEVKPPSERATGLVFLTKYRQPWAKDTTDNPVTKEYRKLLDKLILHRPGLGLYAMRRPVCADNYSASPAIILFYLQNSHVLTCSTTSRSRSSPIRSRYVALMLVSTWPMM